MEILLSKYNSPTQELQASLSSGMLKTHYVTQLHKQTRDNSKSTNLPWTLEISVAFTCSETNINVDI